MRSSNAYLRATRSLLLTAASRSIRGIFPQISLLREAARAAGARPRRRVRGDFVSSLAPPPQVGARCAGPRRSSAHPRDDARRAVDCKHPGFSRGAGFAHLRFFSPARSAGDRLPSVDAESEPTVAFDLAMGKGAAINRRIYSGARRRTSPKAEELLDWSSACHRMRQVAPDTRVHRREVGRGGRWPQGEPGQGHRLRATPPRRLTTTRDPATPRRWRSASSLGWAPSTRAKSGTLIPASIVDALGEQDEWFCKDNPDKAMASCDAPEETYEEDCRGPGGDRAHGDRTNALAGTRGRPRAGRTPAAVTFAPPSTPRPRSRDAPDLAPRAPPASPVGSSGAGAGDGRAKARDARPDRRDASGSACGDSTGWRRPPPSRCTPEDFMLDFAEVHRLAVH